jgi:hypothetical protein
MDFDDGVMVNSAALWPLLEPQRKDPKNWWRELATFTIYEPGSDDARARYLRDHPTEARDLLAKETQRRARKAAKASGGGDDGDEDATPLLDPVTAAEDAEPSEEADG